MEKKYTPGNWSIGKLGGTVITDKVPEDYRPGSGHDATDYYGGFLIAESINNIDAKLIAAAPELLEACKTARKFLLKNGITYDNADAYNILNNAIKKATE